MKRCERCKFILAPDCKAAGECVREGYGEIPSTPQCDGSCETHGEPVQKVRVFLGETDWGEFHYCPNAIDEDTINGHAVVVEGGEDRRTLQAWNRLWPRTDFKDRETWLSYCRKWWPKIPELVEALEQNA